MNPRPRPEASRRSAPLLALAVALAACTTEPSGGGISPPASGSGGRGGSAAGTGGSTTSGSGGAGGTVPTPGSGGIGAGGNGSGGGLPPDASSGDDGTPPVDAVATEDGAGGSPGSSDAGTGGANDGPGNGAAPLGQRVSLDPALTARWVGTRRTVSMDGGSRIYTAGFEAGKFGGGGNGHIIRFPIAPGSEYIFEYRVRFDAGFDFSRGGKIPGLQGASAPSGCKRTDNLGFSARQMWREQGRLITYLYDMDQSGACGNTTETGVDFTAGRWYSIKLRLKLNTASNRDGVYQLWVDDRQVTNRTNQRWMIESPTRRIDDVMLDFFFGGSTADWAPSRNCSISFGDMFLTRVAE